MNNDIDFVSIVIMLFNVHNEFQKFLLDKNASFEEDVLHLNSISNVLCKASKLVKKELKNYEEKKETK